MRSRFDLPRLIEVTRAIARRKVDIIQGFLDASNAYAFLAGRMLRKPTVLALRNERLSFGGIRRPVLHAMYRRAGMATANSRAGERYLLNVVGVPRERVMLLRNWFPSDRHSQEPKNPDAHRQTGSEELIGYAGRFVQQKRLDLLLRAFHVVSEKRPKAKLVLIGSGKERDALEDLSRSLGLGASVSFLEPVIDIASEMQKFSCFVLPSSYEGLPNVVIESLALGIPVVASRVGDVSDLVIDGQTGVLVERLDPDAFAAGILEILSNPELTARARREGPRLVRENYPVEAGLEKLIAMYERLLRQKDH